MKKNIFSLILLSVLFIGCGSTSEMSDSGINPNNSSEKISYLALGDSYTIGESVAENKRWPVQLVDTLRKDGFTVENAKIIAKTGWRTDQLLVAMEEELGTKKYELVSVLIGVNNQYQGRELEQFQEELETILQQAINQCKNGKDGVFVVSIPDYSVTPFAQNKDTQQIAHEISIYNERCMITSADFGVKYFYITDISEEAATNEDLLAEDGLHPSGEMYRRWVERMYPEIKAMLNEE